MILVNQFHQFNRSERGIVYETLLKNCMNKSISKIIIFVIKSTNIVLRHPKIQKIIINNTISTKEMIDNYLIYNYLYIISNNNIDFSNSILKIQKIDFKSENPLIKNGMVIYKGSEIKPKITEKKGVKKPIIKSNQSVAIVLHLYYQDLWFYFKEKIENIDYKFDLYVTLNQSSTIGQTEWIKENIEEFGGKVFIVPNKGLDIGPFFYVLDYIFNKWYIYDHLIKLHSKKSVHNNIGDSWRDDLVDSLIGSNSIFQSNLNKMDDKIGMIGSEKWIWSDPKGYNNKYIDYYKNKLGLQSNSKKFIGGTMFIIDFNILKKYFIKNSMDIYEELEEGYFQDNLLPKKTHSLERIFGNIVYDSGKVISY